MIGRFFGRERLVGAGAALGGLLVTGGAFLPWLSFYAGLYPMRGVVGPWGRVLAGGGIACAFLGAWAWARRTRVLERGIALLASGLGAFALWLLAQLAITFRALRANPMLVPRVGPGLFVVLSGALLALAPVLLLRPRRAAST